jgi:hypothetical protein
MQQPLKVVKEEKSEEQIGKEEQQNMMTIAGGVEITARHLDGSSEQVKVRQIPATKLETFMTKVADEATSVSIYCDKPLEWVDSLDHKSITEICDKGLEINRDFLNAWCRRRAEWTEMLNVGVIADLQRKLEALNEILASVSSAQKLPTTTGSLRKK